MDVIVGVTEMAAGIVPIAGDAVLIMVIDDSLPESTSLVAAFIGFRLISPTLICLLSICLLSIHILSICLLRTNLCHFAHSTSKKLLTNYRKVSLET